MIIIQFDGKFKYFLNDSWNITLEFVVIISVFVESLYIGNESISIGIIIIVSIKIVIIVNLFEYKNFSFDATLVM